MKWIWCKIEHNWTKVKQIPHIFSQIQAISVAAQALYNSGNHWQRTYLVVPGWNPGTRSPNNSSTGAGDDSKLDLSWHNRLAASARKQRERQQIEHNNEKIETKKLQCSQFTGNGNCSLLGLWASHLRCSRQRFRVDL